MDMLPAFCIAAAVNPVPLLVPFQPGGSCWPSLENSKLPFMV
jgi:hypothetical protein